MDWLITKSLNLVAGAMLAASSYVLAVADVGAIEKLVATFGTLVALAWYMYHDNKVVKPAMHRQHADAMEKKDKLFSESLRQQMECSQAAFDKQGKEFRESLKEVTGTCKYRGPQ